MVGTLKTTLKNRVRYPISSTGRTSVSRGRNRSEAPSRSRPLTRKASRYGRGEEDVQPDDEAAEQGAADQGQRR